MEPAVATQGKSDREDDRNGLRRYKKESFPADETGLVPQRRTRSLLDGNPASARIPATFPQIPAAVPISLIIFPTVILREGVASDPWRSREQTSACRRDGPRNDRSRCPAISSYGECSLCPRPQRGCRELLPRPLLPEAHRPPWRPRSSPRSYATARPLPFSLAR